ncbi:polymorphic toxin-type HINT domain-containing protein [Streptomyces laurentii]|uniref:polymorphic toxin-type HINT domain-containing protein n=1 Tax=Streptomyces laurentii TaxID=39478 RepID=UPI0036B1CA1E
MSRRMRLRKRQGAVFGALAFVLSIPTPLQPLAQAAELPGLAGVPTSTSVKVHAVTEPGAKRERAQVARERAANRRLAAQADQERVRNAWPKAQTITGRLGSDVAAGAGGVVEVRGAKGSGPARLVQSSALGTWSAKVLDQKAARSAGVTGVLFTVAAQQPGAVEVAVDYSTFGSAVGGAWATRLGLVSLPACALTTPQKAECRETTSLAADNDIAQQTVTASLSQVGTAPRVLALAATAAAGSDKGAGDYKATPLSASSSWEAGGSSGSFTWSYPLLVPPAAAGPAPSLSLSYDSGSVDGRTANTNNQGSQVGEGWDLTSSYIERRYGPCDDDGQVGKNDQCWKYENASLVLDGKATELVKDDASGQWRLKNDDASKVVHATGADNGDEGDASVDGAGEYWKVITGEGTTYTFGLNKLPGAGTERTNSVWTVPVFGDDSGEPGYGSGTTFSGRAKKQAWRWNLDLVEDVHGNASTRWYTAETNSYAKNGDKTALASFTRGGYLNEMRYGQRSDALFTGSASGKVLLDYKERCKDTGSGCGTLTADTADKWPDVPFDSICSSTETDCKATSPAFFTRKLLSAIRTEVWSTAAEPDAYKPVDTYTLTQQIFDGQDIGNSSDQVWALTGIKRTGKNGTAIDLPTIGFTYQQRPNRVDGAADDIVPLTRPRISTITSETGAITTVAFSEPECVRGSKMPKAEDDNDLSCYPVYWPVNGGDPQLDWFNKYRVIAVNTADPAGHSSVENAYAYEGPAWHYNDDPFTKEKERTWSTWRGYRKVTAYTGSVGATRSKTVSLYMQGMNGDRLKATGTDGKPLTRSVTVAGIDIDNVPGATGDELDVNDTTDTDQFAGYQRQTITYDGALAVGATVSNPWFKQTASQQKSYANVKGGYVRTSRSYNWTYLTAAKKWRASAVTNEFDSYGMVYRSENHGDWSATGDETCARTWYARNDAKGLTSLVSRVRTVGQACAATDDKLKLPAGITDKFSSSQAADQRGDVLSDTAMVYDNTGAASWTAGQTPTLGLPTWTGRATGYTASATGSTADRDPSGWQTLTKITYDGATAKLGRPLTITDAAGRTTTTAYYPATAGPLTSVIVTKPTLANGQAHKTYAYFDPARGSTSYTLDTNLKRTEYTYDALGRTTAVWAPDRSKSAGAPANATFAYGLNQTNNKPSWSTVSTLNADAQTYTTSYSLVDSLLRPLQTQTPSPDGGRVITDTRYDSRGLAYETYADIYDTTTAPNSTYTQAEYGGAPQQIQVQFDGLGRQVKSTLLVRGEQKFAPILTTYTGDSVATTAQQGGTATRTITDALGRTTEARTYAGTQPDDPAYGATLGTAYTSVKYDYLQDGKQRKITGPDGATWAYTYDLYGRQDTATDPDKGTSTTTYTALDQIDTTKDARNRALVMGYDEIGRKTSLWQTSKSDANILAEWTYDSLVKGLPDASIRYIGGKGQTGSKAYTRKVTAYDSLDRPTTTSLTLPADDPLVTSNAVTQTTETSVDYNPDGTVHKVTEPAAGGLAGEPVNTFYNSLGMPTSLSGTSTYLLSAKYTGLSQLDQLTLGSAGGAKKIRLTNSYEPGTGRLTNAEVTADTSGSVRNTDYTYDPAGNVTSIFDHANTGNGTDFQCFTHDGQRRLTEAWTPKTADCASTGRTVANLGGAAPYWTSYTYNTAGQRVTEKQNTTTPVTRTYCYNDNKRTHALTATTTDGNCTDETAQYTYDATGNTVTRAEKAGSTTTQSLDWSTEGKLTKLTEGTTSTDYLYDADGELLIRRASATSGETVLYLGATEVHLQDGKKWANRYYSAAGTTIALRTNETGTEKVHFLAADHQGTGNLSLTGDDTQTLTKRYTTPFGAPRGTTAGTWPDDKTFLGKPADSETSLTHIGAREYDPTIGQFISVDPALVLDQHQSLNGYAYANNSPVTSSDSTGLWLDDGWGRNEPGGPLGGGQSSTPGKPAGGLGKNYCYFTCGNAPRSSGKPLTDNEVASKLNRYNQTERLITDTAKKFLGTGDAYTEWRKAYDRNISHWPGEDPTVQDLMAAAANSCAGPTAYECPEGLKDAMWSIQLYRDYVELGESVGGYEGAPKVPGAKGGGRGGCKCFLAGTDVKMADGSTKDIEKIEVGDEVLATDPETGETGARKVSRLIVTDSDKQFNELTVATDTGPEKLTATHEHPFWSVSEHRWVEAGQLKPGMTLRTDHGTEVAITANRPYAQHVRTYNLTVEDLHTYYVLAGNTPVLVHNSNCLFGTPPKEGIFGQSKAATRIRILEVIGFYDMNGRPPAMTHQGGRRGRPIGEYGNENGQLPERPLGYYTESDVWPSGRGTGGRGAERLVFGRKGEVYYTSNHYNNFIRLR